MILQGGRHRLVVPEVGGRFPGLVRSGDIRVGRRGICSTGLLQMAERRPGRSGRTRRCAQRRLRFGANRHCGAAGLRVDVTANTTQVNVPFQMNTGFKNSI